MLTLYDRPNWNKIFRTFCETSPNEKLGVFFCGPHSLGTLHTPALYGEVIYPLI